jgi:hypothetical protein
MQYALIADTSVPHANATTTNNRRRCASISARCATTSTVDPARAAAHATAHGTNTERLAEDDQMRYVLV